MKKQKKVKFTINDIKYYYLSELEKKDKIKIYREICNKIYKKEMEKLNNIMKDLEKDSDCWPIKNDEIKFY